MTAFQHRIVLCGSMSFFGDIIAIQRDLGKHGIPAIVPEAEDEYIAALSEENFAEFKRRVSFRYLKKIRSPETIAILAVNRDKHGIHDYIGPNTFGEIAVAFAQRKKIFLLQGIPVDYEDELRAWGAVALDGNIENLLRRYRAAAFVDARQLRLF